jgi:hypothetical protein
VRHAVTSKLGASACSYRPWWQGQLVCRYHGWEFNGEGKAVSIPMSTDEAGWCPRHTMPPPRHIMHRLYKPSIMVETHDIA